VNARSADLANLKEPFQVLRDQGKGRAFIIISEAHYADSATPLAEGLIERTRVIQIISPPITRNSTSELVDALVAFMGTKGLRQASFVAISAAATLVQSLALRDLRLVRTLALIDATTRPHPGWWQRTIDRLERIFPLGLPVRLRTDGFDAKPYLQRIRCPVLIVATHGTSAYVKKEATVFAAGLPTAWEVRLRAGQTLADLTSIILDFQDIPARCPQKAASSA
jgi:pimeloyl-ACP methyl ester carboxylesterase